MKANLIVHNMSVNFFFIKMSILQPTYYFRAFLLEDEGVQLYVILTYDF